MSIVVKCKAIREIFKNGDFRILAFEPFTPFSEELKLSEYFTFSCKGEYPYISIGKEYDLEIELISYDKKYGGSYKILSVLNLEKLDLHDLTREESFEILMDCTSSEKIANNILDAYPNFIEIILMNGKEAINVKLVKGVGDAYLNAYTREIVSKYKYYHIIQKFKDYKIDISDAKVLCDNYKDEFCIEKMIKDNPYKVLKELERSFENSDKLIMELRPELRESEQRCAYLILSVLERNEYDGSTRLNGNILYNYIENEYNVPELLPLVVKVATENDLFYYDEESKDLAITSTYLAECRIAEFVKSKIENSTKLNIDWKKYKTVDGFELTNDQMALLENFCNYNFTILSGVSGGGKTSSLKALTKLMDDNNIDYCLLALTGSASLRITNQTKKPSSTIHRKVLRDGNINSSVIIVDEMSMVGIDVFIMLLNAITNENCRVVLSGDFSQIPSITNGCIFSDLIKSNKVPMKKLLTVFRYATNGGSFVGENIRNGRKFLDNEIVKVKDNIYKIFNNYKFIQSEEDDIFDNVINEYRKLIEKYKKEDIIILTPYNVSNTGSYKINHAIEEEFNPQKPNEKTMSYEKDKVEIIFKVGSRVVNIKNDYKAMPFESYKLLENDKEGVLITDDVKLTQIFNGQLGIIRSIDDKKMVIQFDEELIVFTKLNIKNLLLGNAISTYRAQGGEWKAVINIISKAHERSLSRNLLYVSNTRGKEYHCDIGDRQTLENSLLKDITEERNTWLHDLMIEGRK